MVDGTTTVVAAALVLTLAWFSGRRLLLLGAALAPRLPAARASAGTLPALTVVVAAHNEAAIADRLLASIARLVYPAERLSVVLVCDGCTDGTASAFQRWAASTVRARVLELPARVGKGEALNRALRVAEGDVVVVLDADLDPRPDFLLQLAPLFADEAVGAAAGMVWPANAAANAVTRYAAITSWVHQLVTSAGKDRVHLDPPTLGASAYRRVALEGVGGFRPDTFGEDVEVADAISRAGWRTRFTREAVAENRVAAGLREYWHQHVRWARGTLEVTRRRRTSGRRSLARRLEGWTASAGYADRAAFLGAVALAGAGKLPPWVPAAYLLPPVAAIVVALAKAGAVRELTAFAVAAALVFPVDAAASAAGLVSHLTGRPRRWRSARAVAAAFPAREDSAA